MVAKRVKSSPYSERRATEEEVLSSIRHNGGTKQHSERILSNDEDSEAEHPPDKYAVEIVDSIGSTIDAKHSVEMIARHRKEHIEYMAFGEDSIIQRSKCKSSVDEEDLPERKDDISSRFNQSKDTIEGPYDEERDDVEGRIGERSQSNTTTRADTVDSRYTDTDGDSRFMNSLDEEDFSSDDDVRNFSYTHVSDERTPRSLMCDFDFQREDFRLKMSPDPVDLAESGSIDIALSEGRVQEQEATSPKDRGENELDRIPDEGHEGLRHYMKRSCTLPFSTNEEKLQQDTTALSRQKPPGHILVEKQQWTSAVAESLRRDNVASAARGECPVDVLHDVVSDLCFAVSPRKSAETAGSKVSTFRVETSDETNLNRRLEGLKDVLSKRPFSPLSSRKLKLSTRKSDLKEALCDLCFVGDSSKKLERLENTLLIETAVRGSEKMKPDTNHDVNQDRPFDEEDSLSQNVTRLVEQRLKTNGNSFASSDLIDLSGNVSLVPVSRTLSLRHPVMAAAMMEDNEFPVCGAWQVDEVNELLKDVRALVDRRIPSRNAKAVETKEHDSLEENNMATHREQVRGGASVFRSAKRGTKKPLGSPRRSYSAHKFSKNTALTEMASSMFNNSFIGETVTTDTRECNASMGMGVLSPCTKTDISVPFDEGDTNITEGLASREDNDKVMEEKVESAIIDDVEDGVSPSLKSYHGTRSVFLDARVPTHCDATGNNVPSVEIQEYTSVSLSKDTGAVELPDDESLAEAVQSYLKKGYDSSIMNDEKALTVLSNELLLLQKLFNAIVANDGESEMPQKPSFRFDLCHVGESLDTFVEWMQSFNRQTQDKTPPKKKYVVLEFNKLNNERESCGFDDSRAENARPDDSVYPTVKNAGDMSVFFDEALLDGVKSALEDEQGDGFDATNKDLELELVELAEETDDTNPKTATGMDVLHSLCSDTNLGSKSQADTFGVSTDLKEAVSLECPDDVCSVVKSDTRESSTPMMPKSDDCYKNEVVSRSIEYTENEKEAPTDQLTVKPDLQSIDSGDQRSQDQEHQEGNHSHIQSKEGFEASPEPAPESVDPATEPAPEAGLARADVENTDVSLAKYEVPNCCGCGSLL